MVWIEASATEDQATPSRGYCLDRTEVSVRAYEACWEAHGCTTPSTEVDVFDMAEPVERVFSRACNWQRPDRHDHPMNCLRWQQAADYCSSQGKRLPSELEWEWAAKGTTENRKYPWGSLQPNARRLNACGVECLEWIRERGIRWSLMYYGDDGWPTTAPIGRFEGGSGAAGLQDLAGNVWEMTSSLYGDDPSLRVIRGGGWAQTNPEMIQTTTRAGFKVDDRGSAIGFRCASDVPVLVATAE